MLSWITGGRGDMIWSSAVLWVIDIDAEVAGLTPALWKDSSSPSEPTGLDLNTLRFRPQHSTIHPIIHLLNHCAEHTNKNIPEFTLAVLCDLSNAFDKTE